MQFDRFRTRFFEEAPRYEWLGTLGHGGIGVVFKARDRDLDEVVAIKVLSPSIERDENALLLRFKREIQLNRRIKHPNVARMFDYGVSGDYPYITMEYIDGKDLWSLVRDRGRVPPWEAVPILRQVARGTAAIHEVGVLHRDLKSQNVIVDREGAVAILDFGLARGVYDASLTVASVLLGTPQYMSPEQALGTDLDEGTDIYAIGVVAWQMLTGRLPYDGDSPVAVAMRHVNEPLPDHLERTPGLSPELRAVVTKALEKERGRRFATALEMEAALGELEEPPPSGGRLFPETDTMLADLEKALDSIVVPAAPETPRRPRSPRGRPSSHPRKQKRPPVVLVVADDVRALLSLATAVCMTGCRTVEVRTGPEALEALLKGPVDLVLMDAELPGPLDGFDVTRVLKSQPALFGIPVLLLSGNPGRSQLAFALQSGATDLVKSPVDPGTLGPLLWGHLTRRGFTAPDPDACPT